MNAPVRTAAPATAAALDALIDDALLRTLEPVAAALARLLDHDRPEPTVDGQPDGFDGIARRGGLEHLLPSEWAIAGAEPDEFLRRYIARELSYLRLARSDERRPQASLVLFDVGPAQLGRPRIAHLACLLVLARRAAATGSRLRWGSLQDEARHDAEHPETLGTFLTARTLRSPPADPPLDALVDDVLVVGGERLRWPARELVIAESADALEGVLIDNRTGACQRARIPLPAPADMARLLRDPQGRAAPGARRGRTVAAVSNLVFDAPGNTMLARSGDGRSIVVIPAPLGRNARPGRVRHVRTADGLPPIWAAGRVERTVVTLTVLPTSREVAVHIFGEHLPWLPARAPLLGDPLPDPDLPLGALAADGETLRATVGEQVITLVHGAWRLQWSGNAPLAASERDTWLTDERGRWPIAPGERIFALLGFGPSVLVADVALGTITRVAADGTRWSLHRSDDQILDATAHQFGRRFAFRTASGAVELRSWETGELLHRVAPQ